MTGKQQTPMYKHRLVVTKLKNPYLDPIRMAVIAIRYVPKKELPAKLIRFSLDSDILDKLDLIILDQILLLQFALSKLCYKKRKGHLN